MNNTAIPTSMDNTNELRNMILDNPELPLMIFAGEEAWNEEFSYSMAEVTSVKIEEVTAYKGYYLEKDDYRDELTEKLEYDYKDLSDAEYFKMIDKKVQETEFIKAIVAYVG